MRSGCGRHLVRDGCRTGGRGVGLAAGDPVPCPVHPAARRTRCHREGAAGVRTEYLQITIAGGQRRWSFEPEVALGGVRPDFVLRCDDPDIPKVAIFTDGHRYHASLAHNVIAADAEKRAQLRAEGYVVLALTHADLVASEQAGSVGVGAGLAPFWLTPSTASTLMEGGILVPPDGR